MPQNTLKAPTWLNRLDTRTLPLRRLGMMFREVVMHPFYALYQTRLEAKASSWRIPRHIGIIMDGNRRFARNLHLGSIQEGHALGADKLEDVLNWCSSR